MYLFIFILIYLANTVNRLKWGSKRNANWAQHHHRHVSQATQMAQHLYDVDHPWNVNDIILYRTWYQQNCMASVYLFGKHVKGMDRNIPIPRDEHSKSGYIPSGSTFVRNVNFSNYEFYKSFATYYLLYFDCVYRHCVGLENWHTAHGHSSRRVSVKLARAK